MHNTHKQSGAVSLFVVLFTALLITVVTVSFITLMLKNQQQASDNDLSQSAYDSAMAGVEDAKRALLIWKACQESRAAPSVNCAAVEVAIAEKRCDTLSRVGVVGQQGNETIIQQGTSGNDQAYNQAYTCVKISTDTADAQGSLTVDTSEMIQLKGTGAFNTIRISWFQAKDMATAGPVRLPSAPLNKLPQDTRTWSANTPALLRAQLIQSGDSFSYDDLDGAGNPAGKSNANTLFLYPASTGRQLSFRDDDVRRVAAKTPQQVRCQTSALVGGAYACSAEITLPEPINGSVASRGVALLRLSALYNKTSYKIELLNGSDVVAFNGVAPLIDATGRANDIFRRVEARVGLSDTPFSTPEATVDVDGNICKNFLVTDSTYQSTGTCAP